MRKCVIEVTCNLCFRTVTIDEKTCRNRDNEYDKWQIVDEYDVCSWCASIIQIAEQLDLIDNSKYNIKQPELR